MRYFRKIVGERLYLSPINPDDTEIYTKWLNDKEVSGFLRNYPLMYSLINERKAVERLASEGQNYAIVLSEGDTLIGNVSLMSIDHISRKAELGIFIGEAENRGKGYGAEAIRLILEYGFKTLNLHSIMLTAHADNERGLACYRKVGFREFGRRRDGTFKDGKYIGVVYMDILDNELDGA